MGDYTCRVSGHLCWIVIALGGGCVEQSDTGPRGNDKLGIAEFQITDDATGVRIVGLSDNGAQVGFLDLRVGHLKSQWMPGDEEYVSEWIDGRQLSGEIKGIELAIWESSNFNPTFQPAPLNSDVAEFFYDPHVAPLLDKWKVSFQPRLQVTPDLGPDEAAFTTWSALVYGGDSYESACCNGNGDTTNGCGDGSSGGSGTTCSNSIVSTYLDFTPGNCGGSFAARSAISAKVSYYSYPDQVQITQACDAYPVLPGPYIRMKSCGAHGGDNICGGTGNQCNGCAGVERSYSSTAKVAQGTAGGYPYIVTCTDGDC